MPIESQVRVQRSPDTRMQLLPITRRRTTVVTLLVIVVLLASLVTGRKHKHKSSKESDEDEDDRNTKPLEAFVDFLLQALRDAVVHEDLQPFPLPNTKREFRTLGFKWPGSGRLHDGAVLGGLETATRDKDAPVRLTSIMRDFPSRSSTSGRQFHRLSFEFKLHDIAIGSNATLKLGLLHPNYMFEASSKLLHVGVDLLLTFAGHEAHSRNQQADVVHPRRVKMGEVKILEYEPFKFDMKRSTGSWLLWGKKLASMLIGKLFKSTIIGGIEDVLDELLSWVMRKVTKSLSGRLLEFM